MKKLIPKLAQNLADRRVQSAANRFSRRGLYWPILSLFARIDFRQLSIPPVGQILNQFGYSFLLSLLLFNVGHIYADVTINTDAAQSVQRDYDDKYFEINNDFEKLRHVLLHLVKTTGKMATYCEVKEQGKIEPDPSQLVNEVLPDLLIHALQIANHFHVDLGEKYAERLQFITDRSNSR
jgi:hypothetical protein